MEGPHGQILVQLAVITAIPVSLYCMSKAGHSDCPPFKMWPGQAEACTKFLQHQVKRMPRVCLRPDLCSSEEQPVQSSVTLNLP